MIKEILNKIKGYKTVTSCVVAGVVAVLQHVGLVDAGMAKLIFELAAALGLYGLYDKVRNEDSVK